jgi:hypothetical protein
MTSRFVSPKHSAPNSSCWKNDIQQRDRLSESTSDYLNQTVDPSENYTWLCRNYAAYFVQELRFRFVSRGHDALD